MTQEEYAKRDLSYLQEDEQCQKELEHVRGAKTEEEKQDELRMLLAMHYSILIDCLYQD